MSEEVAENLPNLFVGEKLKTRKKKVSSQQRGLFDDTEDPDCGANFYVEQKGRREKDPFYEVIQTMIDEINPPPLRPVREVDPGVGSYNERAEIVYNIRHPEYLNRQRKIAVQLHLAMGAIADAADPLDWSDRTYMLAFSLRQRRVSSVGLFTEELFIHLLRTAGLPALKKGRVDVVIANWYKASVKHSQRDRENDKAHAIQLHYKFDISIPTLQEFADNNTLLVIVDSADRARAISLVKAKNINLPVYSLDEGITKIKERMAADGIKIPTTLFS
jgi:hypothetical protein